MPMLESVFNYLMKENQKVLSEVEKKESAEKITQLLSDDYQNAANKEQAAFQAGDCSPEQLVLLAYCDIDILVEKNTLWPKIQFFIETQLIILDTLRQNCRMMKQYNTSAKRLFEFCFEYKCKKEFLRVSETLHQHF